MFITEAWHSSCPRAKGEATPPVFQNKILQNSRSSIQPGNEDKPCAGFGLQLDVTWLLNCLPAGHGGAQVCTDPAGCSGAVASGSGSHRGSWPVHVLVPAVHSCLLGDALLEAAPLSQS